MVMTLRIAQPDFGYDSDPRTRAKCLAFGVRRDYDPWFGVGDTEADAMAVCNGNDDGVVCPRRTECLIFALKNNEGHGVWGGMTTEDRDALRRFTRESRWQWRAQVTLVAVIPSPRG
jgi:hypothetical protein